MTTTNLPEVLLVMQFIGRIGYNGETLIRRFETCEEAWSFERTERKKRENRRADKDKQNTVYSFCAGCTITGKTYGGCLYGVVKEETLEDYKAKELRRAKNLA